MFDRHRIIDVCATVRRSSIIVETAEGRSMPRFLPSLTAALAWGAMFPIARPTLERVDAFHLTAIRYLVASAIFAALLVAIEGRRALRTEGRALELWLLGTLGFAGFNLLTYVALEHTRPQDAALIVATVPVIMVLVGWILGTATPRRAQLALTAVAFVGVALVISHGDPSRFGGANGPWELLVLAGVFGWVAYTIGARRFPELSALRYTTLTASLGLLSIVAITAVVTLAGGITTPSLGDLGAVWWRLLYVAVPAAVIAVLAWNDGVRRLGAPNGSLFINLVPVVTFAIAIAQGYRPGGAELGGAALTIAALVAANLVGRRPAAQASDRPSSAAWAATRAANALKSRA
jgi:drug/metabolite transporter (DMT)-like permease